MSEKARNVVALIGLVGTFPALLIVSGGIWQMMMGQHDIWESILHVTPESLVIHPVIVLGGLLVAISLNMIPIFMIRVEGADGSLSTTLTIQYDKSWCF